MQAENVVAAIMAGGRGERLWPKSRIHLPKHNFSFFGGKTVFQDTLALAKKISAGNVLVVTNRANLGSIAGQSGRAAVRVIAEPVGKNTAAAVGLAAVTAYRENKSAVVVAMPSDSVVDDEKKFIKDIKLAVSQAALHETIIILGTAPASAETAYGYIGIERGAPAEKKQVSYKVADFVEKPGRAKAKRLVKNGRYYWNSGIFVFKASALLPIIKRHCRRLYEGLISLPRPDSRGFDKALAAVYGSLKSESFDYAILEKEKTIRMVPACFAWSDMGSFSSIAGFGKKDSNKNMVFGRHIGIDTTDSYVFSSPDRLVATIGVKGVLIVFTPDAILVCDKRRIKDIRKLVEKIKKERRLLRFL